VVPPIFLESPDGVPEPCRQNLAIIDWVTAKLFSEQCTLRSGAALIFARHFTKFSSLPDTIWFNKPFGKAHMFA
jgi:hypothetical protein